MDAEEELFLEKQFWRNKSNAFPVFSVYNLRWLQVQKARNQWSLTQSAIIYNTHMYTVIHRHKNHLHKEEMEFNFLLLPFTNSVTFCIFQKLWGTLILMNLNNQAIASYDGKLVDDFSHKSDVTSLQDPFTSRPYKTPFYFYYCVPRRIRRCILLFLWHLGSSTAANWVSFDLNVSCSSCWGYSLINTLKLKKKSFKPCRIFAIFSTLSLCACSLRHRV